MQKYSIFVKTDKLTVLTIAFLVLIFLYLLSQTSLIMPNVSLTAFENGEFSMYNRLKNGDNIDNGINPTPQNMNNYEMKNANIPKDEIILPDTKTVLLYNCKTNKVEEIPLEQYTLCSLLAEMPQSFHSEALMAQAVACRTFAIRGKMYHEKHQNADVCTDYRCCQSYYYPEDISFDITKAKEAVEGTRGIIAVYENEPILAVYHASSVGTTRSSAEVWGGEVAYLVPVIAPENKESTMFKTVYTKEKLIKALKGNEKNGKISFTHGTQGFCTGAVYGEKSYSPKELMRYLGLRSDTFSVTEENDGYVFLSYGYGHGVGMSQYGANALAEKGYDFLEILKYYYTGTRVEIINN